MPPGHPGAGPRPAGQVLGRPRRRQRPDVLGQAGIGAGEAGPEQQDLGGVSVPSQEPFVPGVDDGEVEQQLLHGAAGGSPGGGLGQAKLNPAQPGRGAHGRHPLQHLHPPAVALFELGDLGAGVGVGGRHQHVRADGLDQPPPLVVQVLQGDQADTALVRHHAQPFHLRYRGPVRALAGPDLLVAVQADDEEVAEATGRFQVHRVALVQDVEGAAGQHDIQAQRAKRADDRADPLVFRHVTQVEVGRVREEPAVDQGERSVRDGRPRPVSPGRGHILARRGRLLVRRRTLRPPAHGADHSGAGPPV